ncbi:lipopolysaccharide transport system permease protein [Butyrivibrio hungatei DSM 14810]|uniref:Transport permease protein n=1 Tax=Butyrivibrio hungatei DSM 14810 TaxID=1121132 RepID=A0A1M7T5B1_9FIRM|nr:ABC transporter permease [Butyrivibrio hungatei]SHN65842.1 lipopolysaccharide transport system permease protein [Butyrivibrio hungatei DSM 14810]
MKQRKAEWDVVITPKRKWYSLNLNEVFRYKDLIILFVKRSFNSQYKQTVLGPMWFVINPLLTTFISTLIFGNIAGIQSDGIPYFLFYLVGYTLWNYFSTCVSTTSTTFTANAGIMGKVYFPRLTMPISSVLFAAINMLVIFAMSIITMIIYMLKGCSIHLTLNILLIPILMFQTAILGLGVGIIISSMTTKYRDLAILVSFGLNLWMYLTPVVYPISDLSPKFRTIILLNPMSAIVQNYKFALLGIGDMEIKYWIVSQLTTIVLFLIGVLTFNRVERTFMDTV